MVIKTMRVSTAPAVVVCCPLCVTISRLRQPELRMRSECAGAASPWFRLNIGNVSFREQAVDRRPATLSTLSGDLF